LEHHIDPLEYLHFVHDIPIQKIIKPNQLLNRFLSSIPQKKAIFTNADHWHANRVLDALNIRMFFDEIVDILDIQPFCKPMPEAFEIAFRKIGVDNPSSCLFVDDSLRNITVAKSLGLQTIWVSDNHNEFNLSNYKINKIEEIIDLFSSEFVEEK
jgi:putative hydrolase of the HAD superfamily